MLQMPIVHLQFISGKSLTVCDHWWSNVCHETIRNESRL